ncbi:MAG TPA: hypothetical protein VFK02_29845 [Kofleriaceae bacterium]|nr:hypothetical protein [Kofleriaceae bacterium]
MSVPMILRYELHTHHPTRTGNHYVLVDDDGVIRAHQNAKDPPPGRAWTVDPAHAPVGKLANPRPVIEKALRKGGFFAMPPRIESVTTQGGIARTLAYVDAAGVERAVTVDRARSPEFDKLVRRVLDTLDLAEIPAA